VRRFPTSLRAATADTRPSRRATAITTFALAALAFVVPARAAQMAPVSLPDGWIDLRDAQPTLDRLVDAARRAAGADTFRVGWEFDLRPGTWIGCDPEGRNHSIRFDEGDLVILWSDGRGIGTDGCDGSFGLFLRVRVEGSSTVVDEVRLSAFHRARRLSGPVVWGGFYPTGPSLAFLRTGLVEPSRASTALSRGVEDKRLAERGVERLLMAAGLHDDPAGLDLADDVLTGSSRSEVREEAVMLLATFGDVERWERLFEVVRNDSDADVRKAAVFWLGQEAGEVATRGLAEVAADDPDSEVRKSAVFALSQSDDEGAIDALVEIVRTHEDAEVVRSALFWLGQSADPRALDLIEEILLGRGDRPAPLAGGAIRWMGR